MTARRPTAAGGSTGEGGYILILALALTAMFGLMLVALLSLAAVDGAVTTRTADAAATRRAADGALQVAMTRLKTASAAQLAASGECAAVDGSQVVLEGRAVDVSCESVDVDDPPVASPGEGGTVLTLLGNYNGVLDDAAANDLSGSMGGIVTDGAQMLNDFFRQGPGLVHFAGETLPIVGDVKVRQSAIGRKQPAPSPAISVTGDYAQGDVGPVGGIDIRLFGFIPLFSTPPCGVLDPSFPDSAPDQGLELHATGTRTCAPAGGRNAVVAAAGPAVAPPATFTASQLAAGTALPACVPGGVVTFTPGAYNYLQTREMNRWFENGLAGCDDVTFWFPPGDYYFDVGGWFDGDRNSLTFDDPSSNWVFGAPHGWDPAAGRAPGSAFPGACDRDAQGVSISMTSRSVPKHRAGRVAICGRRAANGSPVPAIYQAPGSATQTWAGVPTSSTAVPPTEGSTVVPRAYNPSANMLASIAPAPTTFPTWGGDYAATEGAARKVATSSCAAGYRCSTAYRLSGFVDPGEPAPSGDLTRAVLKIAGTASNVESPALAPDVRTYVRIRWGDESNRSCFVDVPDVPRSATNPMTIDLWSVCKAFPYDLVDASQLEGATVDVYHNLAPTFCFLCVSTASVSIDYAWIETTTTVNPPSTFSTVVDPDAGNSLNVFGSVHMPKAQIEVTWAGSAGRTPVFVGGVTARALASIGVDANRHVGVLVAKSLAPPRRLIVLRAFLEGRVVGATEVEISDADATGRTFDPGRLLEVRDWTFCRGGPRPDLCTVA